MNDCHSNAKGWIKVTIEELAPDRVQIVPNATATLKLFLDSMTVVASAPNTSSSNEKAVSSWS